MVLYKAGLLTTTFSKVINAIEDEYRQRIFSIRGYRDFTKEKIKPKKLLPYLFLRTRSNKRLQLAKRSEASITYPEWKKIIKTIRDEDFIDLPDNLAAHLFLVAKKISVAVRNACHPVAIHHISDDDVLKKGYNLVAHYKFHIIPRFKDDGIKIDWKRYDLNLKSRAKIAEKIKKHL